MSIKILVISDYRRFHPTRCEGEIYLALAKKGMDISIMTFDEGKMVAIFKNAGIKVINFHPLKRFDRTEIRFIRSFINDHSINIIHLYNSRAILNGIQAAKGLNVKIVLYRGLVGQIHWYNPIMYLKFLHPAVDKIICNSIGVKESLDRQLFFTKSKAIVINKGHDIEWYKDIEPIDVRGQLNLDKNSFLLVNVAVNRKMKGIPWLIKAMALLPKNLNVHLILIGSNMDNKQNLALISKNKLEKYIHILGYKNNALSYVASCDSFVLPSIGHESITKAVIEAMCLGVTPIITDIAGNDELIIHQSSGLKVSAKSPKEMANAISNIAADRQLCEKMGYNAKLRIQNQLNHKTTVDKMYNLYHNLMDN